MVRRLGTTLLCAAITMIACASKPEPPPTPRVFEDHLPHDAVLIKGVPPLYREWFDEVKECVGSSRIEYERIKWYTVITLSPAGFYWKDVWGREFMVAGLAYSQKVAIVMGDRWLLSADHIRHELLHLIASPTGHDAELFQRKCPHLVACYGFCRTDTLNAR